MDTLEAIISDLKQKKASPIQKVYKCNICKDKGYILSNRGARDCTCRKWERWRKKLERNGLFEKLKSSDLKEFKADTLELKTAKAKAIEYVSSWGNKPKSMIIMGKVGTGKTHLALGIVKAIAEKNINSKNTRLVLPDIYFYNELITRLKASKRFDSKETTNEIIEKLQIATLLVIDDFLKIDRSDEAVGWLFEIINARYNAKRPTIITSELTTLEIIKIDEALGSRLVEMVTSGDIKNIIMLDGNNKRLSK